MCNCALTPQVPHIYAMQPGRGRGLTAPACPPGPAKPLLGHLSFCRSWPGPTACTSTPRSQSAALPRPRYNQRIRRFVLKLVFLYAAAAVLGLRLGGGRAPLRASHVVPSAPLRAAIIAPSIPWRPFLRFLPSFPPPLLRALPVVPPTPRTWFAPRPAPRAAIGLGATSCLGDTSGPGATSASGAPCEGAAAGPWRRAGCEGHGGPARREAGGRRPGPAAPAGAPAPRGQRRRRRARPEAGEGR